MFTGIYQSAVMLLIITMFYTLDFIFMRRYDKERQAIKSGRSWDFTIAMFVVAALLILQPIFLPVIGVTTASLWGLIVQILGIGIAVGAIGLHFFARNHLRHYYAERVEIIPGHQIIDTGPYAFIRHPVITSFFGLVIGLFLITPAITTLLIMLYTFWDFGRAARQEEGLLTESLPGYSDYMERTNRFIPRPRRWE